MDLRQSLKANSTIQAILVVMVVVLVNVLAARHFMRVDLTADRVHSLDLTTRSLVFDLDKPLVAKVFFTQGLEAPYNNHEQILIDKLEELRAYSGGLLDIQVADPSAQPDKVDEARGFGIEPIQYRYRSQSRSELKTVYMGLALVYGGRQETLPAITQTQTLEYDLARAIKNIISGEERQTIGFSTGHGEPDMANAKGPLTTLRDRLVERYNVAVVPLGGAGMIPDEVDAMLVVGPQQQLSERARYQLDQFLMRGGALAVFVNNTKPDMRVMRPLNVYHGLEPLLGGYGVQVNRDIIIDRTRNGVMKFPAVRGKRRVQVPINYPLIPKAIELDQDSLVVKDLDEMLFPFASSITLEDPLPTGVEASVLARSSDTSTRLQGLRTIEPAAFTRTADIEEPGPWPMLVSLTGQWRSAFEPGAPPSPDPNMSPTNPDGAPEAPPIGQSAHTRLVVSGSADFVANNLAFVLNLSDWLVQDENLIRIRSKTVQLAQLEPIEPAQLRRLKAINLMVGPLLVLLMGLVRWGLRRSSGGMAGDPA